MAQIYANNHITAVLVGSSLIIAILSGILTARWITQPILRLNVSTQALTKGKWDHTISVERIDEIGALAWSFNNMGAQLKQTLVSLKSEIAVRRQAEAALKHKLAFEKIVRNVKYLASPPPNSLGRMSCTTVNLLSAGPRSRRSSRPLWPRGSGAGKWSISPPRVARSFWTAASS